MTHTHTDGTTRGGREQREQRAKRCEKDLIFMEGEIQKLNSKISSSLLSKKRIQNIKKLRVNIVEKSK